MSNFVEVFEPVVDFSRFSPNVRDDDQWLYAKAYPDKIKVFHYVPIVYPKGLSNF